MAIPETLLPRLLCLAAGYICGCLLTAELVARITAGKSMGEVGGNPGMANIMLKIGKAAGMAVLAGDAAKTVLACVIGWCVFGSTGVLYAGLGAVLGHDFPLWRGLRGGKGVAVTCVWLILYMRAWGLGCCAAGGAVVLLTGYLPLGAVIIPALAVLPGFYGFGLESGAVVLAAALLMLSRHYRGLQRIVQGREKRFFRRAGS